MEVERAKSSTKGSLIQLGGDDSDVSGGGRNKDKPDGNKKVKDKRRKQDEASSLRNKIDDMVKSKEMLTNKTLESKMLMAEMKNQENQAKWQAFSKDEMRKAAVEEMRAHAEEKVMAKLIAEVNKILMMDPTTIDIYKRVEGFDEGEDLAMKMASD
jgi:hypothetical protein